MCCLPLPHPHPYHLPLTFRGHAASTQEIPYGLTINTVQLLLVLVTGSSLRCRGLSVYCRLCRFACCVINIIIVAASGGVFVQSASQSVVSRGSSEYVTLRPSPDCSRQVQSVSERQGAYYVDCVVCDRRRGG